MTILRIIKDKSMFKNSHDFGSFMSFYLLNWGIASAHNDEFPPEF